MVASQLPVMSGLHLLDQGRLLEQGTDLATGFNPFDPPYLLCQAHFLGGTVVAGKVRQDALADLLGLPDVQRQGILAVKQIDTRAVGQGIDEAGVEVEGRVGRAVSAFTTAAKCSRGWLSCT